MSEPARAPRPYFVLMVLIAQTNIRLKAVLAIGPRRSFFIPGPTFRAGGAVKNLMALDPQMSRTFEERVLRTIPAVSVGPGPARTIADSLRVGFEDRRRHSRGVLWPH